VDNRYKITGKKSGLPGGASGGSGRNR
jgi:hypothetical protein